MAVTDALKIKDMTDTPVTPDTKLPLFDYQKVGSLFMLCVKKCFVLDEPGLGKTGETLGYLKLLQKAEKKTDIKALVVTTSTLLYQWEAETKKFTNLLPVVVDSKSKQGRQNTYEKFARNKQNVLIINYTKILYDFDYLSKIKFDTIIFDEASALKDNGSKIHQYYKWLTKPVDRVVMLTATPISNNLEEFYNLFDLFHENFLPEYTDFREHFLETKTVRVKKGNRSFNVETIVGSKLDMIPIFKEMINPYFIRRTRAQVKQNEESDSFSKLKMNIVKIPILMSYEQKTLCTALKREHLSSDNSQALKIHSDFEKICCAPQIFDETCSNVSPKAIHLIKYLQVHRDKKFVVFARFIEYHKILQDYLTKSNITFVSITGEQSAKEKEENKLRFNNEPDLQVILITGAGKYGLNLQVTNQFIFMDIPYTPSDVFQYIGRVLRTGQTKDVDINFIYNENSLEEDLFNSLERKQSEIDKFFDQNNAEIFKLGEGPDLSELNFESGVNVRQSFLARNYMEGKTFDSTSTPQDWNMVPEKRKVTPSSSDDSDSSFVSVDLVEL